MEPTTVAVLVIMALAAAGVGVMAVAGSAAERRRSRVLSAWADRHGWHYDRDRPELVDRFDGPPFVERRSNARTGHVLCAERRGRRVMAYEYGYTAPHSEYRNRTVTHVYTVVVAALPEEVPPLQVQEAHAFPAPQHRLAGAHPWRSGQAGFDERFRVITGGEAFAETVLGQDTRTWLLCAGGVCPFRFSGQYLLSWERGRLETGRVEARADAVIDLLERLPAGVWEGSLG